MEASLGLQYDQTNGLQFVKDIAFPRNFHAPQLVLKAIASLKISVWCYYFQLCAWSKSYFLVVTYTYISFIWFFPLECGSRAVCPCFCRNRYLIHLLCWFILKPVSIYYCFMIFFSYSNMKWQYRFFALDAGLDILISFEPLTLPTPFQVSKNIAHVKIPFWWLLIFLGSSRLVVYCLQQKGFLLLAQ